MSTEKKKLVQTRIQEGKWVKPPQSKWMWTVQFITSNDDPKRFYAHNFGIKSFETKEQATRYLRKALYDFAEGEMFLEETDEKQETVSRFKHGKMTTKEMEKFVKKHAKPEHGCLGTEWTIEKTEFIPKGHDDYRFDGEDFEPSEEEMSESED
jgi:hypothetical protein